MYDLREAQLTQILLDLRSTDTASQLAALRDLGGLDCSSEAIVLQLEQLAVCGSPAVRRLALEALDSQNSQYVRKQTLKHLKPSERLTILAEIADWSERLLILPEEKEVLVRRYDWNRPPLAPAAETRMETAKPAPAQPLPAEAGVAEPAETAAPKPAGPRLTLSERLLSQTTINIAFYLGAFLVIGAAVILAALVEVTRLPILLGGTAVFGAGAIAIKRRLPQPSFILFLIFSFLLPISAGVVGETLRLRGPDLDAYWTVVFLVIAAIWAFGVWFYSSRLFILAAFAAWCLAFFRFTSILQLGNEWQSLSLMLAALGGLAGVQVLKTWKDRAFALWLFVPAQLVSAAMVLWSLSLALVGLIDPDTVPSVWMVLSLTWIGAAGFYAWSGTLFAFRPFAWIAVAALLPISWTVLRSFSAPAHPQIIGLWVWGTLFCLAGEWFRRRSAAATREYHWPLLRGSLLEFLAATIGAFASRGDPLVYAFFVMLGAAVVYALLTLMLARDYTWITALLFGLGAYFTFFALPLMKTAHVYLGYQMLGASLLLLLPELRFGSALTRKDTWRWPPFGLGVLMVVSNLMLVLIIERAEFDARALIMAAYALLYAGYALRRGWVWVGYLATASAAVACTFALQRLTQDGILVALTGLAVLYFLVGSVLKGERTLAWRNVLRLSALALGAIVSCIALVETVAAPPIPGRLAGYAVLVISLLFFAEIYIRREDRMEIGGPLFASAAAFLILRRFDVTDLVFHLLAFSLIWLTADLVYRNTLQQRKLAALTRLVGGLLAAANGVALLFHGYFLGHFDQAAILFAVYAVFFAASAWLYRQPRIGFAVTASAAFALLLALQHFQRDLWLPMLTGLAALYWIAGYVLRTTKGRDWASMLRLSALVLGAAVSGAAVILLKQNGGWYVLLMAALFFAETYVRGENRLEVGGPLVLSAAAFLVLRQLDVTDLRYQLLAFSLIWLGADLVYSRTLRPRPWAWGTRFIGGLIAGTNALVLIFWPDGTETQPAAIAFGIYAIFFAVYAWIYSEPRLGYVAAAALPLSVFFVLRTVHQDNWLYAIAAIAVLYYAAGYVLRRGGRQPGWSRMLLFSGLGLGVINSISAPLHTGLDAAIPVAIAATLFAVEAFALKNVWLGFPANVLYLGSYFLILTWLKVDQPQFFSIGAALLGLLMHYLLSRAGSKTGAFLTGTVSQLALLGTTFIQLLSTEQLGYFVLIFFQGLVVLGYGIVVRSRSLVIAPIAFIVVSVLAVLYTALKGLTTVVLIGCSGMILLLLGILAVLLRERLTRFGTRLSEWQA